MFKNNLKNERQTESCSPKLFLQTDELYKG